MDPNIQKAIDVIRRDAPAASPVAHAVATLLQVHPDNVDVQEIVSQLQGRSEEKPVKGRRARGK